MKKSTAWLLLTLVAIIMISLLTGCKQETPSPNPPSTISTQGDTKIYSNYKYKFSFSICNNKEIEVAENYKGTIVALRGPMLADLKQEIAVFVIVNKLAKGTKFEDYLKASRKEAEKILPKFAVLSEKMVQIGGIQAQSTLYTYTANLNEQDYTFKNTLLVFMKDDTVYAIKYETPEEFYDEYADCFNLLVTSFKFN